MIKHIKCDIFKSGADAILHQVNCQGVMGSGVAKQVREKYPKAFNGYKKLCDSYGENRAQLLGTAQYIELGDDKYIVNIFAQDKFGYDGKCYTDYNALKKALGNVNWYLTNKTIAIPYLMGSHRGGGDWNTVYKIIKEVFDKNDVLICEYVGG